MTSGDASGLIERAEFGRTGHASSRVIFGSAGTGRTDQETADRLLPLLLRFGINHIDTAASYGDAELRLAPWLRSHRDQFFLATKTGDRTGTEARASLERSLERLGVDHVDLVQLHNLVEEDEWEVAHGPGGALEALEQARAEGLTRFVGVTGHGLRIAGMHLRSLERFDYDSVLFPYNFTLLADASYRADVERLLEVCAERRVAVQTIKSIARRRFAERRPVGQDRHSWYEPFREPAAISRAVGFVLARPQLFLVSSSEFEVLETLLESAAVRGPAPTDDELAADVETLAITPLFDGADLERI